MTKTVIETYSDAVVTEVPGYSVRPDNHAEGHILIWRKKMDYSEEDLKKKISETLVRMKSADPVEVERVKGILKAEVPFFTRSAFAAYLLMTAGNTEKGPKTDRTQGRVQVNRKERPAGEVKEKTDSPEKVQKPIPEGAKTLYIDVGKMKHLYPKDLSKLLQFELGITRDDIYMIRIHDKYSFVTMSEENCQKAIEQLNGRDINGRVAKVTLSNR